MPQLSQQSPLVRHWLYKLLKRPLNQVSSDLVWILRTCEEERKVSHEKNRKRKKKRWKVVKNRGGGIALVVGEDLQVSKVEELEGRAIVGKFYGRWMSFFTMEAWVDTHWSPNLGYSPTFHLLLRGWIGCVFWSKEDAVFILSNHRYWNRILFVASHGTHYLTRERKLWTMFSRGSSCLNYPVNSNLRRDWRPLVTHLGPSYL